MTLPADIAAALLERYADLVRAKERATVISELCCEIEQCMQAGVEIEDFADSVADVLHTPASRAVAESGEL